MKLETFSYTTFSGWSVTPLPPLDSDQTLVIVFGAPEFFEMPDPITELVYAYPHSRIIGCSSAGEIFGAMAHDHSLVVSVIAFEHTVLAAAATPCSTPEDAFRAGQEIAAELYRPDLRGILVLSDGLQVNGTQLVDGLNTVLPESVVVTGGLAGDGDRFERTWVLHEGVLKSGYVTAVAFYGNHIQIGHGSKGGWDAFGPERVISRSTGNVLYELDGKPALELYRRYLGEHASNLPASGLLFPLAMRRDTSDTERVVRTILAVNQDEHSITFAGDMPEGYRVQLMKANFDRLIEGAAAAALSARKGQPHHQEALSVAISCVGRRLVLNERIDEELEAILDVLPAHTRQIGFYAYGEISPYSNGSCTLHNQTMTLTLIYED